MTATTGGEPDVGVLLIKGTEGRDGTDQSITASYCGVFYEREGGIYHSNHSKGVTPYCLFLTVQIRRRQLLKSPIVRRVSGGQRKREGFS